MATQVLPSAEYSAAMALGSQGKLMEAVAKLESARVNFVEGDTVTMDQIKKELQRFLTRFSLDPYLTLGVSRTVEVAAAKKAYRKLILKYHPDKNPHTTSIFRAVQQAFETISDPAKRREIDRQLATSSARAAGPRMRRASTSSGMGTYAQAYARYAQTRTSSQPRQPGRRHSNFGPGGSAYQRPPPPPGPHPDQTKREAPKSRYHGKAWSRGEAGMPPPGGDSGSSRAHGRRGSYAGSSYSQRAPPPPTGSQSSRRAQPTDYRAWAREYKRQAAERAARAAAGAKPGAKGAPAPPPPPQPARKAASSAQPKPAAAAPAPAASTDASAKPDDFAWSGSSYSYNASASDAQPSTSKPSTSRRASTARTSQASAPPPPGPSGSSYPQSRASSARQHPPDLKMPPGRTPRPNVAARSDTTATLDWEQPATMPVYYGVKTKITAYEVQHRPRAADLIGWSRAPTKTIVPKSPHPTAVIPNLKPSTPYEVRTRAGSASGWGEWSEVAFFTTAPTLAAKQAGMMRQAKETRAKLRKVLEEKHAREVEKARQRINRAKAKAASTATPGGEPAPSTPREKGRFRGARRRASYVARMAAMESSGGNALKAEELQAKANIRQRMRERMAERQYGSSQSTPRGGESDAPATARSAATTAGGNFSDIEVDVPSDAGKRLHRKDSGSSKSSKKGKGGSKSSKSSKDDSTRGAVSTPVRPPRPSAGAGGGAGAGATDADTPGSKGSTGSGGVMGGVKRWFKKKLGKKKAADTNGTADLTGVGAGSDAAGAAQAPNGTAKASKSSKSSSKSKKGSKSSKKPSTGSKSSGASSTAAAGAAKPPVPDASKPKPSSAYLRTPRSARTPSRPSTPAPSQAEADANRAATQAAQASGAFWYEAYDAGNDAYYYVHSITQESRWDAPLWMEYMDEDTHASYYVNSYTSSSQWERPSDFVPIRRQSPSGEWVSTPITEAQAASSKR